MSRSPKRRSQPRPPDSPATAKRTEAAYRIFETSSDGQRVLDDLCEAYYDRTSFVSGDPQATAFNEGARSVVLAIFQILEDLKQKK
jgi:hypothetical protein